MWILTSLKKLCFDRNASVEIPILNDTYCRSVREPTRRRRANFVKTRLTLWDLIWCRVVLVVNANFFLQNEWRLSIQTSCWLNWNVLCLLYLWQKRDFFPSFSPLYSDLLLFIKAGKIHWSIVWHRAPSLSSQEGKQIEELSKRVIWSKASVWVTLEAFQISFTEEVLV